MIAYDELATVPAALTTILMPVISTCNLASPLFAEGSCERICLLFALLRTFSSSCLIVFVLSSPQNCHFLSIHHNCLCTLLPLPLSVYDI